MLFPLLIWFGHGKIEPKWLAGLLLLAAFLRLVTFKKNKQMLFPVAFTLVIFAVLATLALSAIGWNALLPLKLYPVLVSLVLLITFVATLFFPPSMIERFARMREPDLPDIAIAYTRRVTQTWCGFFIVNGAIAFGTAIWATEAVWSLYTGVISYVLMGLLFGGEFLYRLRFKRTHHG